VAGDSSPNARLQPGSVELEDDGYNSNRCDHKADTEASTRLPQLPKTWLEGVLQRSNLTSSNRRTN